MSTRVRVGTAVAATAAAALAVSSCTGPGVSADDFGALRMCESSGNYAIDTGNGYYGAYQFDLPTWEGLGFTGLPNLNNPATQDAAAYKLYDERGWAPWPTCSVRLGLQDSGAAPAAPAIPPQWPGAYLSTAMASEQSADVLAWQNQMYDNGWTILPRTGEFDQTTANVAGFLGMLVGVSDGTPGVVGPNLWALAFSTWHG
jgi:resuscitation-promoting factor RpfA